MSLFYFRGERNGCFSSRLKLLYFLDYVLRKFKKWLSVTDAMSVLHGSIGATKKMCMCGEMPLENRAIVKNVDGKLSGLKVINTLGW